MKRLLLGPVHYFKKKSYIKGFSWLFLIGFTLYANFFLALFFWFLAGWFGGRGARDESMVADIPSPPPEKITKQEDNNLQYTESPTPENNYEVTSDFPEADDKGMKQLRILDRVRLTGVTRKYEDVNPQDTIESLNIGEEVFFKRIPMKKYPSATLVVDCNDDPIGWIPEDFSYQEDIAKRIDNGTTVKGIVNDIIGGENGKSYGVLIDIARYGKKRISKIRDN